MDSKNVVDSSLPQTRGERIVQSFIPIRNVQFHQCLQNWIQQGIENYTDIAEYIQIQNSLDLNHWSIEIIVEITNLPPLTFAFMNNFNLNSILNCDRLVTTLQDNSHSQVRRSEGAAEFHELEMKEVVSEDVQDEEQILDSEDLIRVPLPNHIQSNDSLHVNIDINEDEMNNNNDDLDDGLVDGGDEMAQPDSSSSSSTESADSRGDAGGSESPSSTESDTETESEASFLSTPSHLNESMNLGGKYGTLAVLLRPRPPSGHRYVISANEVNSHRRNDNHQPLSVPTYAQQIECILNEFLDEMELRTVPDAIHEIENNVGPSLDLVFVRLTKGNPPTTLIEFDDSDSEDSCIRSIATTTKRRKSCLKISRDGNVGESRPKNLSWSQHVYIAQIPAHTPQYDDDQESKSKSCPGIYFVGEFSIHRGKLSNETFSRIMRRKHRSKRKRVMKLILSCFRCHSPPPIGLPSTVNLQQQPSRICMSSSKRKVLSPVKSNTHLVVCSAYSIANRSRKFCKIKK